MYPLILARSRAGATVPVLSVFPTHNCVYIGRLDRPLNAPRQVAFRVSSYLAQVVALTEPAEVSWCVGAASEPVRGLVRTPDPRPGQRPIELVCSREPGDVDGPGYWADPARMRQRLRRELRGVMRDRTLQVTGFAVADQLGILATDSPDVLRSLAAIATIGDRPLARISAGEAWRTVVHCRHSSRHADSCVVRFRDSGDTWAWGSGHRAAQLLGLAGEPRRSSGVHPLLPEARPDVHPA